MLETKDKKYMLNDVKQDTSVTYVIPKSSRMYELPEGFNKDARLVTAKLSFECLLALHKTEGINLEDMSKGLDAICDLLDPTNERILQEPLRLLSDAIKNGCYAGYEDNVLTSAEKAYLRNFANIGEYKTTKH